VEVLPAIAVCSVTFAVCQWATASFLGPYLPTSSPRSRRWRPWCSCSGSGGRGRSSGSTTRRPLERETHDYSTAAGRARMDALLRPDLRRPALGPAAGQGRAEQGHRGHPVAGLDNAIARNPAPPPRAAIPRPRPPPAGAAAPVAGSRSVHARLPRERRAPPCSSPPFLRARLRPRGRRHAAGPRQDPP
jgi:hypothetical protein